MKPKKAITIRSSAAEYLTFVAATGDNPASIEMRYQDENVWLTQRMMAELYGVEVPTVNEHIAKIFADKELTVEATIRNFRIVQTEGARQVSREVKHYNLQTLRHIPMTMEDWESRLNGFLTLWNHDVLQDNGKISAELAKLKAETEFEKYRLIQDQIYLSDFDRFMMLEEASKKN